MMMSPQMLNQMDQQAEAVVPVAITSFVYVGPRANCSTAWKPMIWAGCFEQIDANGESKRVAVGNLVESVKFI